MKRDTTIVSAGRDPEANHGIVNPPVYHTSTIIQDSVGEMRRKSDARARGDTVTMYGRIGHPTSLALEEAMAELEGGFKSFAFPSGLAAIATAMTAYVGTGDHVLITDSAYRPTRSYCDGVLKRMGVETTYYDPLIGSGIAELIRPNTKIVYVEAPGSQTFEMQDIPAIAEAAHAAGAFVLMDNTWATPLFFRPFEKGVDVSIHAGTKYIVGHSDAMLGIVTTNEATAERFLREVDSACVHHNVSTRFSDGEEFGFGAEIGISTDKLHARGPMALRELTSYQYRVRGEGQLKAPVSPA